MSEENRPSIPPHLKKMWKDFGANTATGRLLRSIYSPSAQTLVDNGVSYPTLPKYSTRPVEPPPRPVFLKPKVMVPRVGRGDASEPSIDLRISGHLSGSPAYTIEDVKGRRKAGDILREISIDKDKFLNVLPAPGTDRNEQCRALQEKFQFGKASCLPKAALPPDVSKVHTTHDNLNKNSGSNITGYDSRFASKHGMASGEKKALLADMFAEVKETQEQLERWALEVHDLNITGNLQQRKRLIQDKQLQETQLKNKLQDTLTDIKLLIDC